MKEMPIDYVVYQVSFILIGFLSFLVYLKIKNKQEDKNNKEQE